MRQPADLKWPRSLQRKLLPGERANDLGTRTRTLHLVFVFPNPQLSPLLSHCHPTPKHDVRFTTEPAQASSRVLGVRPPTHSELTARRSLPRPSFNALSSHRGVSPTHFTPYLTHMLDPIGVSNLSGEHSCIVRGCNPPRRGGH